MSDDELTRAHARIDELAGECLKLRRKAIDAEARLADLVTEVREWNRMHHGTIVRWPGLESILRAYEVKL